jgi:hypothetical protein
LENLKIEQYSFNNHNKFPLKISTRFTEKKKLLENSLAKLCHKIYMNCKHLNSNQSLFLVIWEQTQNPDLTINDSRMFNRNCQYESTFRIIELWLRELCCEAWRDFLIGLPDRLMDFLMDSLENFEYPKV